jgi:hypothetical protein
MEVVRPISCNCRETKYNRQRKQAKELDIEEAENKLFRNADI